MHPKNPKKMLVLFNFMIIFDIYIHEKGHCDTNNEINRSSKKNLSKVIKCVRDTSLKIYEPEKNEAYNCYIYFVYMSIS